MLRGKARLVWLAAGMLVLSAAFIGCGGGDDGNQPTPPVIDTASPLPSGTVGTAYSQTFAAIGGTPPYSWSVTSGTLPAGLTLSTTGILSGMPTTVDNSNFTVQVTGGGTATKSFSLTINADLVIDTASPLPSGTVGTAYNQTFAASGGISPYSWSVTSGTLPAGLTLSTAGILSGTPTTVDNSNFTVQVTGGDNATKLFSLEVNAGPKTIRVEGNKYLILLDNWDNTVRYRAGLQVKDAAGNVLTDTTALKGMKIYDSSAVELSTDNNFVFWNGATFAFDNGTAIIPDPQAEIEMYLTAAPGTLSQGFYTASVTDNTGNIYTSTLWFETPMVVGEPAGLIQVNNLDNSITLSWTNPTGIPSPAYYLVVSIFSDDTNGDGITDYLLYARRVSSTTSYTIPAEFVQDTLVGKTGLSWSVEVRQQTAAPITFPDDTQSFVQIYRNRSALVPLTVP